MMVCGPRLLHIVFEKNNMNTKDLLQKGTAILNKLKRGYAGGINAERDWLIVLGVAGIVLLISAVLNAISFVKVYEGEPLSKNIDTNPPGRETQEISDRLLKVEGIFDAREKEKETFINTEYPFVDPARN